MTDLIKALKAHVAVDNKSMGDEAVWLLKGLPNSWSEKEKFGHSCGFGNGTRLENARLKPILEKLIAVVEAADVAYKDIRMNETTQGTSWCSFDARALFDAVADLRASVIPEAAK